MEFERRRDTVVTYLTGDLDQCSAGGIRRELDQWIEDPSVRRLILDMKGLYPSSGLAIQGSIEKGVKLPGHDTAINRSGAHRPGTWRITPA